MAKLGEKSLSTAFIMVLMFVLLIPFLPKKQITTNMQILSIFWAEYCHVAHAIIWKII